MLSVFDSVGLLTLLFSCPSCIRRNHSPALITVQPSISTLHCKTLNISIKVCYSLHGVAAMIEDSDPVGRPRRLLDLSSRPRPRPRRRPPWSYHHTGTLPRLISFVSHSCEGNFIQNYPSGRRPVP